MSAVRVLLAGTPEVALPTLELLVEDARFHVVGVLTNPDRPRGRSSRPVPSPVAERALELGLPVLRPERVRDEAAAIVATGAEIGAVVAYGSILPAVVLDALPLGFVNLHFSLLPRWRGAAPVQHAIAAGDEVTGVTAFRLDEGMDTGPVLRSLEVRPPADVDAGDLLARLAVEGAPVLVDALLAVVAGEAGTPQPEVGVSAAPRIRPEDAVVAWDRPAVEVARRIRSVTPRPGATTSLDGVDATGYSTDETFEPSSSSDGFGFDVTRTLSRSEREFATVVDDVVAIPPSQAGDAAVMLAASHALASGAPLAWAQAEVEARAEAAANPEQPTLL
jgi:methionyl-tRNA formyltransferase